MLRQVVLRHHLLQVVHEAVAGSEGFLLPVVAGVGVVAALDSSVFQHRLQLVRMIGQSCILRAQRKCGEITAESDDLRGFDSLGRVIAGVVLYAAVGLHHL